MTKMVIVRHGQTDWNIEGKWQGHSDIPLNSTGIQQADEAAERLKSEIIDQIYSSDLSRALETAKTINQHHQKPIFTDTRLREQNLGRWEGIFHKDIHKIYPEEWEAFRNDPGGTQIIGGESVGQLSDRIREVFTEIAEKHPDERILIVAHGLAIAVFLCHVQGKPLEEAYKLIVENAKPVFIEWNGETDMILSSLPERLRLDS